MICRYLRARSQKVTYAGLDSALLRGTEGEGSGECFTLLFPNPAVSLRPAALSGRRPASPSPRNLDLRLALRRARMR